MFAAFALKTMAEDLSTPETALRSLEAAYSQKNIEAAVAARDFKFEARELLVNLKGIKDPEQNLVDETSHVLELSFRKQMRDSGFPNFSYLSCVVVAKKVLREDLVELIEECVFPDGGKSRDTVHAAKSPAGWRIVILPQ
ncbi:hypothetical protein [Roseateles sp.]|uniref:hypothetical protein n=1 Tax=Roseateles sp. TaxID=1971397 RepID=UPI003D0C2376